MLAIVALFLLGSGVPSPPSPVLSVLGEVLWPWTHRSSGGALGKDPS